MRLSVHRLLVSRTLLLMFLLPLGGSSAQAVASPAFSHGKLFSSCGPVDQPLVILRVTTRNISCHTKHFVPYIGLTTGKQVSTPMTIIIGGDIGKTGLGDSAQRCLTDNGGCDAAVSGTIVFELAAADAIVGHYDLRLKNGDVVSGPFKATWCHERHMCW
jgi:hypothetical protein